MKVLVTGASGFIGSHLVSTLLAAGMRVRAAGRRPPASGEAEFRELPNLQAADWPALLAGMDAVIHLAAVAHTRGVDESAIRQANYEPVIALCRALAPGQKFVFMSSIRAIVGPSSPDQIDEHSPPRPGCVYGRWKRAAEEAAQDLCPEAVILRPTTVYGAGAKFNMGRLASLARLPVPLPVAGFDAPRSYVSVQNVCSAATYLLQEQQSGAFNVSDPDVASVRDLVMWLRQAAAAPSRMFAMPATLARFMPDAGRLADLRRLACEPLVVRPDRLIGAGWSPEHGSSRDGVYRWAQDSGGFARV